jgi:hypothetical protein
MHASVQDIVTDLEGFEWILENGKGGFRSMRPGDNLRFTVRGGAWRDHEPILHEGRREGDVA